MAALAMSDSRVYNEGGKMSHPKPKLKCGALECGVNKKKNMKKAAVMGSPRSAECSGEISILPAKKDGSKYVLSDVDLRRLGLGSFIALLLKCQPTRTGP